MKRKRRYVDYDYENTFDTPLSILDEQRIKKMLKDGKLSSIYCTKTIKSGNQFEVEIYPEFTKKQADHSKLKKKNNKAQKKLNDKNARKRLERLINSNFEDGDFWITLTYDNKHLPNSIDDAVKNMRNYLRKINYRRKKLGLKNAKYIYITEYSNEKNIRCHHHLILEKGMSMDAIELCWIYGKRNNIRKVDPDEDGLTGLAKYLTKDPKGKKRWCSSRGLKKPKERKSYTVFPFSKIRKMIIDNNSIEHYMKLKYKNKNYVSCDVRFNEYNGKFYIYKCQSKNVQICSLKNVQFYN